ncbi:hypothetical protein [Thioalkalivibrio sulfidiphilus]|uniref:Uncharacterized protein n=1 Tax=Thioalkalivibrio sulfidiphilus (strain HL-EbGR7) TaxID=396588 RepID=B8GUT4_THISH|nr:hypothetical protein [Thioalkalivibrio sulfidiphilus]ACL71445.1 hypothetical protein Tgr7_0347 [Thioalkalivibrio sulfidiphilus HL-EbGr7]
MKIIQRHFLRGSQELEVIDDYVRIRSKAPFKPAEELTVMLTVLNPEPRISRSSLSFTSRVNGDALITLQLGKPDTEAFNAFVALVKRRAVEEYQAFAGLRPVRQPAGLEANVYDEPPDFDDEGEDKPAKLRSDLDAERIDEAIRMLRTYLSAEDIQPLLSALEALSANPGSAGLQSQVVYAFNELGPRQGAVLTYAPYVGVLLSDGPAGAPY